MRHKHIPKHKAERPRRWGWLATHATLAAVLTLAGVLPHASADNAGEADTARSRGLYVQTFHGTKRVDHWRPVPKRMWGIRVDGLVKGSFRVTRNSVWRVGGTTLVLRPDGRVGTS